MPASNPSRGSPANMGSNLHRLGCRVALAASVGQDDMGTMLFQYVQQLGMDTQLVHRHPMPSTLILVTKSKAVSNFEPYRLADVQITPEQLPEAILQNVRIFHTTCFALSREPARSSILAAADKVADAGGDISIDVNYASKIWPDQREAQQIVWDWCSKGALVKCSEVDWERLYGFPLNDPMEAADFFHGQGASIVCITLGDKGCYVSNMRERHTVPARPVVVRDTTGAGDAFWSGFLCAYLDGHELLHCAYAGRKMAEEKLQRLGPLPPSVSKNLIYGDFIHKS
ncbi:MAG: PfkB family carbohydrate kinase [Saprospiraceae bacterium]